MSFYSDASLVLIPSGYKDQKVYSAVPTDGSGDLTFSRASNATRVASNGLIEKVRTNVALQSEAFDTASWSKANTTITENAGVAPNGTTTADKIVPTTTGTSRWAEQSTAITTSIPYTNSFFVKADGFSWVAIHHIDGNVGAWFNVSSGTIGTVNAGCTALITSVGNGWYRCSVTKTSSGSIGYSVVQLADADNSTTATASGTNGLLIWGAQTETGDIATDYIATTSAAVSVGPVSGLPRLDYLNSTCPRLLLEPQRTNIITSSERFNAMSLSNLSVTANDTTSPDGYTNADRLTPSGSGFHTIGNSISVTAGTPYTISFFYKNFDHKNIGFYDNNTSGSEISINVQDNTFTLGANVTAGGVISYGNGWYRAYATFSPSTTTMNNLIIFRDNTNNGNYTATGSYIWAYGWQVEAGAYATSYIPTLGTSVTRVADLASKTGISSLIGQTEGTIFAEINFDLGVTAFGDSRIQLTDGTTSNWIFIGLPDGQSSNLVRMYVNAPSGSMSEYSANPLTNGVNKIAFGYKSGSFVLYINGVQAATRSTTLTMATCSRIDLQGAVPTAAASERINYNQVLLFKTRLTNESLAALTSL